MNRLVAILAVIGVFFVGAVAGVLGTHIFYSRALREPGGPPAMASSFFAQHLERRLGLNEAQAAEIGAILERTREQSEAMRREMRPRVEGLLARTMEEIAGTLTPDQRLVFEEMRRDRRRRMEQFLLKPPGPRELWRRGGPRDRGGVRPRPQGPERPPEGPPPPPPPE